MAYLEAKALISQRRLKSYDVSRKHAEYNIDAVVNESRALLDGPECMRGYRFVW